MQCNETELLHAGMGLTTCKRKYSELSVPTTGQSPYTSMSRYSIRDRIYYGRLFISSKNKLVQRRSLTLIRLELINKLYNCLRSVSYLEGNFKCS